MIFFTPGVIIPGSYEEGTYPNGDEEVRGRKKIKYRLIGVALGLFLLSCPAFSEEGDDPAFLNKAAYIAARQGAKALLENEERLAYERYREAVSLYEKLVQRFPDWKPRLVKVRLEGCRLKAAALEEKIFRIPAGFVEIAPGMAREGKRFPRGRFLIPQVRKTGDDRYGVGRSEVALIREGPLLGAKCTCPDFKYRGSKFGYACEHIWAVILKEKLLKEGEF